MNRKLYKLSSSPEDTQNIARAFTSSLSAGSLLALCGNLGSGKTHFVQGLAKGLGVHRLAPSPTFSILQEYGEGSLPLFHFDFYRVKTLGEILEIGWDELLHEGGIIVVEWAELFPELFDESTLWIDFKHVPQKPHMRSIQQR